MKKRILALPLLTGLLLSGCTFTIFGQEITLGKEKSSIDDTPIDDITPEPPKDIPLMEEYGNYKLADSIVAGKRYLLGSKREQGKHKGEVRFFNGNYHVGDEEGEPSYGKRYSYYLGTTAAEDGDLSFAAELEAVDAGNGEFYFLVHTSEDNPWNGKYMGLYPSTAISRKVLTICLLDSPESTTTMLVDDAKNYGDGYQITLPGVINKFKYFNTYGDDTRPIKTFGFMYQHTEAGDKAPVGKFFGTEGDYSSFDCKSYDVAMDPDAYDLAHLYEAKEAE